MVQSKNLNYYWNDTTKSQPNVIVAPTPPWCIPDRFNNFRKYIVSLPTLHISASQQKHFVFDFSTHPGMEASSYKNKLCSTIGSFPPMPEIL